MSRHTMDAVIEQIRHLADGGRASALTDQQLLERFIGRKDEAAFAALVRRHGPMILGLCRRLLQHVQDAEDVFQASFLVLARKAAGIRKQESVGSWLYGVAYRLALKAKSEAGKRRRGPQTSGIRSQGSGIRKPSEADPLAEISWREVCTALDEELARLPDRCRAPLVLCYLQDKTQDEALHQLGWSKSTFRRRLDEGRKRLCSRLTRRGITLSAGLWATLLSDQGASAAIPSALSLATVQTAIPFAAGGVAGATVSPQVTLLVKEGLKAAVMSKMKWVALVGIAAALTTGMGLAAHRALTANQATGESKRLVGLADEQRDQSKPEKGNQARLDRYGDPLPEGAIARLGTLRLWQGSQIPSIAFLPEGKVFVSTDRQTICFRDVVTGKKLPSSFPDFEGHVRFVLSPNGKTLAAAVANTVRILDLTSQRELQQFKVKEGYIAALAFSPDCNTLATGSGECNQTEVLKLWDVAAGKEIRTLKGHTDDVFTVAFSPDGKTLASGSKDQTVRLWDPATGKEVRRMGGWEREVHAVAFSSDGKILAAHGEDRQQRIYLWEVASGNELPQFKGNTLSGQCLLFSRDGKTLIVGGYQKIHLFEVASGKELSQFGEHQSWIQNLALSPDNKLLAAASGDNTLSLWDTATWNGFYRYKAHQGQIGSLAFSRDGKLIVSADWGTVRVWEAATGSFIREFPVKTQAWLSSLAFSPDGKLLAYGSCNGPRRLWEVGTWNEFAEGDDGKSRAACLAFSPDGRTLASVEGYGNLSVQIWNVATGEEIRRCVGHENRVYSVTFSPDGATLLSASHDKTIRLWKAATGDQMRQFIGHEKGIDCMALSPDGRTLASGSWDEPIRLWEVTTGKQRLQIGEHLRIGCLAFSPDGRTLASGSTYKDNSIQLWEVSTGKELAQLKGHLDRLNTITFSPDGKTLASGSADSTALIWDVTRFGKGKPAPIINLKPQEIESLWKDLANADSTEAFRAINKLTAAPQQIVSSLKARLQPARLSDSPHLLRLLRDLGSDQFMVRDKATQELEKMGDLAEPSLRHLLYSQPALDLRRRLENLLDKIEKMVPSPENLRGLRSVEILERTGTPEAQEVLKSLAQGAPEARLTQEAKASLDRLSKRPTLSP